MQILNRPFLTTVALMALTTGALADAVPIHANYGTKDGCVYAKTGDSSGADDFFLLTKDAVTTATAQCTFGKIVSSDKGKIVAHASCDSEGDTGDDVVTLTPSGANAYDVTFDDGSHWGPVPQCK